MAYSYVHSVPSISDVGLNGRYPAHKVSTDRAMRDIDSLNYVLADKGSLVTFYCPNRAEGGSAEDTAHQLAYGFLSEPWQFDHTANWGGNSLGSLLGGVQVGKLPSLGKIASVAESAINAIFGRSINQPILQRKSYQGSEAGSITLNLTLVAYTEDQVEGPASVKEMVNTFISFVHPQVAGKEQAGAAGAAAEQASQVLGGLFKLFTIPGPSPIYPLLGTDKQGAWLRINIGTVAVFSPCYVENVSGKFTTYDPDSGNPTSAELTIKFRPIDSISYSLNGDSFNAFNNDADSAYNDSMVTGLIQALKDMTGSVSDTSTSSSGTGISGARGANAKQLEPDPTVGSSTAPTSNYSGYSSIAAPGGG